MRSNQPGRMPFLGCDDPTRQLHVKPASGTTSHTEHHREGRWHTSSERCPLRQTITRTLIAPGKCLVARQYVEKKERLLHATERENSSHSPARLCEISCGVGDTLGPG